MHDLLPPIFISVSGSLLYFLKRIAVIAKQTDLFKIDLQINALGDEGVHVLNLRLKKSVLQSQLGGQLIVQPNMKKLVAVEIIAERWSPDDSPSYDTYVAEARSIFLPLLSAYNRRAHTRYRLLVPSKDKLGPKFPPQTEKIFKRFTRLANKSALHPLDWRRFYEFVRDSRIRVQPSEGDVSYLLVKEGFSEKYAGHISEIYSHLFRFKHLL